MQHEMLGAHLRLIDSYVDIAEQAAAHNLNHFQFFLVPQKSKVYVFPSEQEIEQFARLAPSFGSISIHSSYWINLASGNPRIQKLSQKLLLKEASVAQKLGVSNIVVHPGSAKKHPRAGGLEKQKERGIKMLCKSIAWYLEQPEAVPLMLENNAHGGTTLCIDLEDFILLRKLLPKTDKIGFCLDTTHAYVHGYDLSKTDEFVAEVDRCMGLENIKVLHLNDTHEKFGSKCDSHAPPGEGNIGAVVLQRLVEHPAFADIPVIIELANDDHDRLAQVLEAVRRWPGSDLGS